MELSCPHYMHLGYFILWTNSSRIPPLSSCSTWAVLLQCIFWLKQMSGRIPVHSHQGHPGMRNTAYGDHKKVCPKAHSSCKLEHDGIIPFKCQAKKNRSLLLSKDRKHRKGISHSREETLTALVPSPGKRVNSRHKHVTCYRALGITFELTKHTLSVLADFVMILHIRS